jgi:SecD/SecF fusion protein
MGLTNPNVSLEGTDRIRVELPGVENAEDAIEMIGKTAQLQFTLADGTVILTGNNVKDAALSTSSEYAGYVVSL